MSGYCRRFIKVYAQITKPLAKYLRGEYEYIGANKSKNVSIIFDDDAIAAFTKVKAVLAS